MRAAQKPQNYILVSCMFIHRELVRSGKHSRKSRYGSQPWTFLNMLLLFLKHKSFFWIRLRYTGHDLYKILNNPKPRWIRALSKHSCLTKEITNVLFMREGKEIFRNLFSFLCSLFFTQSKNGALFFVNSKYPFSKWFWVVLLPLSSLHFS